MTEETYGVFLNSNKNFSDFVQKIKDRALEQIRGLTISEYHVMHDSYIINRLCHFFPKIERLHVSIKRIDNIIQFIHSCEYLSNASFNLHFLSDDERNTFIFRLDCLRPLLTSTFTYHLDGVCLRMWIKKGRIFRRFIQQEMANIYGIGLTTY